MLNFKSCCITWVFLSSGFSLSSYAACERQDIEFYLSKGFTPTQITAICTDSATVNTADKPEVTTESSPDTDTATASAKPIAKAPLEDPTTYLAAAINAEDVQISATTLQYQQQVCTEYGAKNVQGKRNKACPLIAFSIPLSEVSVTGSQKRLAIFGDSTIKLKGNINRRFLDLDRLNKGEKRAINRFYKKHADTVQLPIRNSMDLRKAKSALKNLIKSAK